MNVVEGKLRIVDFALQIGKSKLKAQRIFQEIKDKDSLGIQHENEGRELRKKPIETEL